MDCIAQGGRWEIGVELCDDFDPPCGQQIGACCMGEFADPPYEPYECIDDMTQADCLAVGENSFWALGESCDAVPRTTAVRQPTAKSATPTAVMAAAVFPTIGSAT